MTKSIKKYRFKPGLPLQVEVVDLKTLVAEHQSFLIIPHRTDFYHIFLFENCTPHHVVDFDPVHITPYTVLFIDKNRVHQFDPSLQYKGKVLIFTDEFFCTTESDSTYLKSSLLFNPVAGNLLLEVEKEMFKNLAAIADAINDENTRPRDHASHQLLKNYLHNFLLLSEREMQKQNPVSIKKGPDLEHTLLFKDLLEKHFIRIKSVSAYTRMMHISEKKLRQSTTAILGKTPKELIDERTLLEARRLLVHEHKSIKEIGFFLGFEEPTNFIKYFRKHTAQIGRASCRERV